jgi:hypothetical protein
MSLVRVAVDATENARDLRVLAAAALEEAGIHIAGVPDDADAIHIADDILGEILNRRHQAERVAS